MAQAIPSVGEHRLSGARTARLKIVVSRFDSGVTRRLLAKK
jgi:hypothetical protein